MRMPRIGLVILATDHMIESEMARFIGDRAYVHVSRVRSTNSYGVESLKATEQHLADAASLILPGCPLDVLAYGCTSGAIAIGEAKVAQKLQEVRRAVRWTTPITAARVMLERMGARRIALLSPYHDEVHGIVSAYLRTLGFDVAREMALGLSSDEAISNLPETELAAAARAVATPDADAVLISCTSLRTSGILQTLRNELSRPVISSNQALAWHCLALARAT